MSPPKKHPLDVDLDLDPDEFVQVVEMIERPPRVIPQLAAAFKRYRRLVRDKHQ